jgi:hypothetical protein
MDLTVTNENSKWKLDALTLYRNNRPQTSSLLAEEELNETKLNDAKNGLDELQIVDVRRKPEGLGADLKADQGFLKDQEGLKSLIELGFIPDVSLTDQEKVDLHAANGEVVATLNNGVEYVLKFGNVSGAEDEVESNKLNRYLLVTARVNENAIPQPELAELPPLPETSGEASSASSDETSDAEQEDADEETQDAPAAKEKTDTDPPAASDETTEPKKATPAAKKPDDRAKIEAERERIAKENQRKQDEHQEKLKTAQKQVRDLNFRFADWYYVVSEDTFKKVRLTRADAIKEKASVEQEGFGVDAFRTLESEGLKKSEPAKQPTGPSGFQP